jgi:hypothetical protein
LDEVLRRSSLLLTKPVQPPVVLRSGLARAADGERAVEAVDLVVPEGASATQDVRDLHAYRYLDPFDRFHRCHLDALIELVERKDLSERGAGRDGTSPVYPARLMRSSMIDGPIGIPVGTEPVITDRPEGVRCGWSVELHTALSEKRGLLREAQVRLGVVRHLRSLEVMRRAVVVETKTGP